MIDLDLEGYDAQQWIEIFAANQEGYLFGRCYRRDTGSGDAQDYPDDQRVSYEDLGHVRPERHAPQPLDHPQPLTESEEYDRMNGIGRFWNPALGLDVKRPANALNDRQIAKDILVEMLLPLVAFPTLLERR